MVVTNEFERDLINQAHLKRPGRIDLVVFQNVADAGDGSPGIQRAFRNYLHEGGMEKDLELIGFGIKGTSVDINNAELQQLSNIGAATIDATQWGYVGGADQAVKQADSPTFAGLTLSTGGAITSADEDLTFYFGRVAVGYDGAFSDNAYFCHRDNLSNTNYALLQTGSGNTNINAASSRTIWLRINNVVKMALTTSSLTMSVPIAMGANNITFTSGLVDGVDVSAIKLNSMPTAADGDIDASTQKIINVVDPILDQGAATKKYVDDYVKTYLPIGTILMFDGAGWVDDSTISGWYKCDGTNGTVDLVDKFVRGGATSGGSGGDDDAVVVTHGHGASSNQTGDHIHNQTNAGKNVGALKRLSYAETYLSDEAVTSNTNSNGDHTHVITVDSAGVAGTDKNMPVYYTLIYIQRIS